jgi:glyoxylase-like metal-dependent hydrolase (beta-lactamase superfamily II)
MHRTTLGDFELTLLTDGLYYADGGAMFGVVPKTLWERKIPADGRNRIEMAMNSLLIRDGRRTVLVETGAGNKLPEKMQQVYETQGKLLDSFAAAKVSPDDVDIVINTHLHFDHCGWNTIRKGKGVVPTFARAKYYAQRGEWEHGQTQNVRDRVSYISDNYNPLIERGQMELISGDREIAPGISVRVYPGHTRHMQAVLITSSGQTACYISDLVPMVHHLDLTWGMGYDLFPLEVIEQKRRFYAEAIPHNWLVVFTHDSCTPWAHIERGKQAGKYVARRLDGRVVGAISSRTEAITTHVCS